MGLVADSKTAYTLFMKKYRLDQAFPDTIYYNTYTELMAGIDGHENDLQDLKNKKKSLDELFVNLNELIGILDQYSNIAEQNNFSEFVKNMESYLKRCEMFDAENWKTRTENLSNDLFGWISELEDLRFKCIAKKNSCDGVRAKVLGAITLITARSALLDKIKTKHETLFNDPSELRIETKTVSASATSGEMETYNLYHYKHIPGKQYLNELKFSSWWSLVPYELYSDNGFFKDNETLRVGLLRKN